MATAIPALPVRVRASELLHGSDADFITNAYLALQRHWPDDGGYSHYLYVLQQGGMTRAQVLREIAASDNARACGVEFVDDLPEDHRFRPEEHDGFRLLSTTVALRVNRTAADVDALRQAVGRLTADELAGALNGLVQAQLAHQGLLESRLNALEEGLRQAQPERHMPFALSPSKGPAEPVEATHTPTPSLAAWHHLAAQQMQQAQQLAELRGAMDGMHAELGRLKSTLDSLHHYATVGLKREVADYVNALNAVQRINAQAANAPLHSAARAPAPAPAPAPARSPAPRPAARTSAARAGRPAPAPAPKPATVRD